MFFLRKMTLFRRARPVILLKKSMTNKTKKSSSVLLMVSLDNSHQSMFTCIKYEFAVWDTHIELLNVIQSNYCWYPADVSITDWVCRCSRCSPGNKIKLNLPKQIAFLSSFTTIPKWVQSAVKMWFLRGGEAMISNWRPLMYRPTPTQ